MSAPSKARPVKRVTLVQCLCSECGEHRHPHPISGEPTPGLRISPNLRRIHAQRDRLSGIAEKSVDILQGASGAIVPLNVLKLNESTISDGFQQIVDNAVILATNSRLSFTDHDRATSGLSDIPLVYDIHSSSFNAPGSPSFLSTSTFANQPFLKAENMLRELGHQINTGQDQAVSQARRQVWDAAVQILAAHVHREWARQHDISSREEQPAKRVILTGEFP